MGVLNNSQDGRMRGLGAGDRPMIAVDGSAVGTADLVPAGQFTAARQHSTSPTSASAVRVAH
jgi:hypothetical protein